MESLIKTSNMLEEIPSTFQVRYKGSWYSIIPKKYEPERQTFQLAWKMIIEEKDSKLAYREWFLKEREDAKLLYGFSL
jgi:hypothetical protein